MIVVDTSAIMAILLEEPEAEACMKAIVAADGILISAATVAETLIVAGLRRTRLAATLLLDRLDLEIVPVTTASAKRSAEAYSRWGKGIHPAKLNYGDCFAYEIAKERDCPLLFVGNDFAQTDIESVLQL